MTKLMVLIDSLYINNSGGFRLLDYLVRELIKRDVQFFLLADDRCRGKLDFYRKVMYMNASLKNRKLFYLQHRNDFSSVLCFGNIPAPIKMNVPVYTYFHNVNLLTLAEANTTKQKIIAWLKRQVFIHYKGNTDYWIVQTSNTANVLVKHFRETFSRVKLLPFYELPEELINLRNHPHGDDFVFVSNYTGAKGHEELVDAWELLHERGIDSTLHLTVNKSKQIFLERVEKARGKGVRIINHGFIPFADVIDLYRDSRAIIYPSHNESLGLGIIEAITAGCDVLGADLPYLHAICKPSGTFNPYDANSIADAVEKYEKGHSKQSELLVSNEIDNLINLICTSSE